MACVVNLREELGIDGCGPLDEGGNEGGAFGGGPDKNIRE